MSEIDFIVYGLFGCCTFIKDCSDCCCVENIDDKKNERKQRKESKDYNYKYFSIEDMER